MRVRFVVRLVGYPVTLAIVGLGVGGLWLGWRKLRRR